MSDGVKHIRPGDAEFEEVAKTVTPLNRIRRGYSQSSNSITATEVSNPGSHTRKESINKLR